MQHFVPEKEAYGRLGLCERNSRLEPAHNGEPPGGFVIVAGGPVRVHAREQSQWQPHVPRGPGNHLAEIWFCHAQNGQRDVVHIDCLAHDGAVAAKLALPIAIIQNSGGRSAGDIVRRLKRSSQSGLDAQRVEKFSGNQRSVDPGSIAASVEVRRRRATYESGQTGEHVHMGMKVVEKWTRERTALWFCAF